LIRTKTFNNSSHFGTASGQGKKKPVNTINAEGENLLHPIGVPARLHGHNLVYCQEVDLKVRPKPFCPRRHAVFINGEGSAAVVAYTFTCL